MATANIRTKNFSTIDKLNSIYADDLKILDCEIVGNNAGTFN